MIIRYKKNKLAYQKNVLGGGELSRGHVLSMTSAVDRTLLSRNHVSSMTGGCTYPMYYQRVVSGDKGSVIIRYRKNKLADQKSAEPALTRPCFQHD